MSLLLTPSDAETLVFWVSQPLPWPVAPKGVPLMTRRGDLKLSHGTTAKARENAVKQDRVPTTNAIKSPRKAWVSVPDGVYRRDNPIFVSHYKDASTKSQEVCAARLSNRYRDFGPRHVRANVSFDKNDLPGLGTETTTRGRSFIFLALAALAADAIEGRTPIYVPENGLISLNVPLDPLRLGAWSTRTTHPFYMARW